MSIKKSIVLCSLLAVSVSSFGLVSQCDNKGNCYASINLNQGDGYFVKSSQGTGNIVQNFYCSLQTKGNFSSLYQNEGQVLFSPSNVAVNGLDSNNGGIVSPADLNHYYFVGNVNQSDIAAGKSISLSIFAKFKDLSVDTFNVPRLECYPGTGGRSAYR